MWDPRRGQYSLTALLQGKISDVDLSLVPAQYVLQSFASRAGRLCALQGSPDASFWSSVSALSTGILLGIILKPVIKGFLLKFHPESYIKKAEVLMWMPSPIYHVSFLKCLYLENSL